MEFYDLKNKVFLISQKAIVVDGDKILMLKNMEDERDNGVSQWELPGGLVEIDEDFEEGLKREVFEETRLEVKIGRPIVVWSHDYQGFRFKNGTEVDVRIVFIAFVCQKVGGEIKLSEEHKEFCWANREELEGLDCAANTEDLAIRKYLETK